jgi:hypothetical protein
MIVVVPIGENVFNIAFFSVPTWYIVHRFHLSMSNTTLVFDSKPLCRNNELLTARTTGYIEHFNANASLYFSDRQIHILYCLNGVNV